MTKLFLATRDDRLATRITGALHGVERVHRVPDEEELHRAAGGGRPLVFLIDPRFFSNPDALDAWRMLVRDQAILLLADPDNAPAGLGVDEQVVAFLEPEAGLSQIRNLVRLALRNAELLDAPAAPHAAPPPPSAPVREPVSQAFGFASFLRAMRHHANTEDLYEKLVDGIFSATGVSRAGLVLREAHEDHFRIRAHRHAPPSSLRWHIPARHPFIPWFEQWGIPMTRERLRAAADPRVAGVAEQAFNLTGAEWLVPILHLGTLQGWLFLGQRSAGIPYTPHDLNDLTALADHLGLLIANTQLRRDLTRQKVLAETLMHCQPTGIIACDHLGILHWYNLAAENILGTSASQVLGRDLSALKSQAQALLARVIAKGETRIHAEWTLGVGPRHLAASAHALRAEGGELLGAVAFVTDHTETEHLREREEDVRWLGFWRELAASISHELYNPLTPITLFTEMLPEHYGNPDFRERFQKHVGEATTRIREVVDQINEFSATPTLSFATRSLRPLLADLHAALRDEPGIPNLAVDYREEPDLPEAEIDETALRAALHHLGRNAREAVAQQAAPRISLGARPGMLPDGRPGIFLLISDNGPGIPKEIREKIFSPFCSTKVRGIGLGLPICRRIAKAHQGRLMIESSPHGTTVSLMLPLRRGPAVAEDAAD